MRVLGIAADNSFAVLETDGRTIEAYGPAGRNGAEAHFPDVELIGLLSGGAQALADRAGIPVATGFDHVPALKATYYRARVRALGLERPVAVADGALTIRIAGNGALRVTDESGRILAVDLAATPGFIEAEAVAYIAARCWNGLPAAFPKTTGAPYPMPAGTIVRPQ